MILVARKKPVEIECIKFTGNNISELKNFVGDALVMSFLQMDPWSEHSDPDFSIRTLEGDMKISEGDYIIKGVSGEFYPCRPEIFEKIYEVVDKIGEAN
jgi:hypothetical protein